ncbi:MAG TPA: CCA tRNA nucleotidyltransferase [Gemmatimonadaceae bacterium]|nr:CCA tRNA nucleotidyltransferase [Gemmatimonadaceae bacterium]
MLEIAERLETAGHEAWCVGGAVRDALLGHEHLDWDLATSARPDEVRALFKRTVPVGVEFGTVGVLDRAGTMHEVTTFRRDVRTDGRHAVVEFGVSLDDDLARRDFTINAIAYSPSRDELRDPFDGRGDLERRMVRAVGDPEARMREDRLRALRALRFAARFEFAIEPATWRAIAASGPHLGRLSAERVKQEIEKTMEQVRRPSLAFRLWRDGRAFATLLPALAAISDVALGTLDQVPPPTALRDLRRLTRLAALFLDVPPTEVGSLLRALRFSNQDVARVGTLVERWHALGAAIAAALRAGPPPDADVRRWVAAVGRERVGAFVRLAAARWAAERAAGAPAPPALRVAALYRRAIRSAFRDPVGLGDLAVDGADLQDAGIPPGPLLGRILHALLDEVLDDPSRNRRDLLLARALELFARGRTSEDE